MGLPVALAGAVLRVRVFGGFGVGLLRSGDCISHVYNIVYSESFIDE